jgi:adenylosuccinate synthase
MPVTVVVGGQYGSEGKGKVAHFLAKEMGASIAVRVGGSNSGHTVIGANGQPIIFRHLPTPSILPDVICVLGAGSYVNVGVLLEEIRLANLSSERIVVDENAILVTENEILQEQQDNLQAAIGSTLSGTGAALVNRITRTSSVRFARDDIRLRPYVKSVVQFLRDRLARDEKIILEGTQGFGLSVLHSPDYPFVTSRDTTAAAFLSEAGLSPLDVDEIVLVLRAFPIRVGGNSGSLPNEIDWNVLTNESGSTVRIVEHTSVTKNLRRIGRFDSAIVRKAIAVNQPTIIVLNHLDHFDVGCVKTNELTIRAEKFVLQVESTIGRRINYVGFGPAEMKGHRINYKKLSLA